MRDSLIHRIRDPIHRFIHFSDRERKIIDSFEFQRLRHLSQLALTFYIYPGAMHSRFEHSLGAMELATRFFEIMEVRSKELLEKNFQKLELKISDAKQILRLCALLHDLGHLPFSHAGEGLLPTGKRHEHVGLAILEDSLGSLITKEFSKENFEAVKEVLDPDDKVRPELRVIRRIVSGNVDVDRTDYLIRDSYHCGVEYGKFDYTRLVDSILVIESESVGGLEPALDIGGVHSIEALILARYFMFTQVYYHRTRRLFDHYIDEYLKLWNKDNKHIKELKDVSKYDDLSVWESIRKDCEKCDDAEKQEYAKRLNKRKKDHHFIFETNDNADVSHLKKMQKLKEELSRKYANFVFILDDSEPQRLHKFFVPGDQIPREEFFIIERSGIKRPLHECTNIIPGLPKEFRAIRLFGDVNEQLLPKVREKAKEIYYS